MSLEATLAGVKPAEILTVPVEIESEDVLGFMGHPLLKFCKTTGWRVYGPEQLSDEVYARFKKARQRVMLVLQQIVGDVPVQPNELQKGSVEKVAQTSKLC